MDTKLVQPRWAHLRQKVCKSIFLCDKACLINDHIIEPKHMNANSTNTVSLHNTQFYLIKRALHTGMCALWVENCCAPLRQQARIGQSPTGLWAFCNVLAHYFYVRKMHKKYAHTCILCLGNAQEICAFNTLCLWNTQEICAFITLWMRKQQLCVSQMNKIMRIHHFMNAQTTNICQMNAQKVCAHT